VQGGDVSEQSQSGVRTPSEALSERDGTGWQRRGRKIQTEGN